MNLKTFPHRFIAHWRPVVMIALAFAAPDFVIAEMDEPLKNTDRVIFADTSSVSAEVLEQSRGKQGSDTLQQMNKSDQRAWLDDNKLNSGLTGNNVIAEGALQGIEGISTVIQNTGNQVIIQDSTLLNLTIAP